MKVEFLEGFSNVEKGEKKDLNEHTVKKLVRRGIVLPVDEEKKEEAKKERARILKIEKQKEEAAKKIKAKLKKIEEKENAKK